MASRKTCFWDTSTKKYDWTGATAAQLCSRDADTDRAMSNMRGGGLRGQALSHNLRGAVGVGNLADVQRYLLQGADPNFRSQGQEPALVIAGCRGNAQVMRSLLDHGARPDEGNGDGNTSLVYACHGGHTECARMLLGAGASVDGSVWSKTGTTPLHLASREGHAACANVLLEAGALVNAPSSKGEVPLIAAAAAGHPAVLKLLLAAGADHKAALKMPDGSTVTAAALTAAKLKGHSECVKVLCGDQGVASPSSSKAPAPRGSPRGASRKRKAD